MCAMRKSRQDKAGLVRVPRGRLTDSKVARAASTPLIISLVQTASSSEVKSYDCTNYLIYT